MADSQTTPPHLIQVPFVDLKAQSRLIRDELLPRWQGILDNAGFILGPYVQEFESAFSSYCGARHAVGVANGTDALVLALRAFEIGPGDEVITAVNSFIATAEAIALTGATPVFADIDPATYTIDADHARSLVSPRTRAIIPVHLYGQTADMDAIMALAAEHRLAVIEDAAQAQGAEYKGRRAGSLGHAACFSFYPSKNLGACGDAGAVVTSDDQIALRLRKLRDHGGVKKYQHELIGYNSRMDGLQGAALTLKLRHLDEWNRRRREHAALYDLLLGEIPGIVSPFVREECVPIYHLYVIRVEQGSRDVLASFLQDRGVQTGIHYPQPIALTEAFVTLGQHDFPVACRHASQILSLPMYPEMEERQVRYVAELVAGFMAIEPQRR
jgi:dTDP-4-amino-4,6-dideoxygalactose transaminase